MVSKHGPETVGDVMTGDLVTLAPDEPVKVASDILYESGLHVLPVVELSGDALGVVSLTDISPDVSPSAPVASIMSKPVRTIDVSASISEAASIMRSEYLHHLVVTENGVTVGILSSYDLLYLLIDD